MSDRSAIEWTQATWNPVTGCDRVSEGCDHCYALTLAKRLKATDNPRYQLDGDLRTSGPGFGLTLHWNVLGRPLSWRRPRLVFVNSMSDLFHPKVPIAFIACAFEVMEEAKQHTFQILTKRPGRMASVLRRIRPEPLDNVWLGTSVENQPWSEIRIRTGFDAKGERENPRTAAKPGQEEGPPAKTEGRRTENRQPSIRSQGPCTGGSGRDDPDGCVGLGTRDRIVRIVRGGGYFIARARPPIRGACLAPDPGEPMRLVLAWGAVLEFNGLWSLLWLVSGHGVERRLRGIDPNRIPRGRRVLYGRTRGVVLMIPFLRVAAPVLIVAGAVLIVVGLEGVLS